MCEYHLFFDLCDLLNCHVTFLEFFTASSDGLIVLKTWDSGIHLYRHDSTKGSVNIQVSPEARFVLSDKTKC